MHNIEKFPNINEGVAPLYEACLVLWKNIRYYSILEASILDNILTSTFIRE